MSYDNEIIPEPKFEVENASQNISSKVAEFFNPNNNIMGRKGVSFDDLMDSIATGKYTRPVEEIKKIVLPHLQTYLVGRQVDWNMHLLDRTEKLPHRREKIICRLLNFNSNLPNEWIDGGPGERQALQLSKLIDTLEIGSELFDLHLPAIDIDGEFTKKGDVDVSKQMQDTLSYSVNALLSEIFSPYKEFKSSTSSDIIPSIDDFRPGAKIVEDVVGRLRKCGFKYNHKVEVPRPTRVPPVFLPDAHNLAIYETIDRFMRYSIGTGLSHDVANMCAAKQVDYVDYLKKVTAPKIETMKLLGITEFHLKYEHRLIRNNEGINLTLFGEKDEEGKTWQSKNGDGVLKLFDFLIARSVFVEKCLEGGLVSENSGLTKLEAECGEFTSTIDLNPGWIVKKALAWEGRLDICPDILRYLRSVAKQFGMERIIEEKYIVPAFCDEYLKFTQNDISVDELDRLQKRTGIQLSSESVLSIYKQLLSAYVLAFEENGSDDDENYYGADILTKLNRLKEIAKFDPTLDPDYVNSLYRLCITNGEQHFQKLTHIFEVTGIAPNNQFIEESILQNPKFTIPVPFKIDFELLDKHFSSGNTSLAEYKRIYGIFGCYDYYQNVLARYEKDGTLESKKRTIEMLAAMAVRDTDNTERYNSTKDKIVAFFTGGDHRLNKRIAEAFAELSKNGDIELTNQIVDVLRKRGSGKDAGEERQVGGLSENQEIALRTLLQMDNSVTNEALLSLLFTPDIDPRVKKVIIRNLSETKKGFLPDNIHAWATNTFTQESRDVPWDDMRFFHASLKIPSADIRKKSRRQIDEAFGMFDHESSISSIHHKMFPSVPENVFMQLYAFTKGDELLLDKFNSLYRSTRGVAQHEALLFGIVNGLTVNKKIQDKVIGHLQNIEFSSSGSVNDMANMLKTVSFLDTVDKQLEPRKESKTFDVLDQPIESIGGLNEALKAVVVEKVREVLPNNAINAEKVQTLWEQWGSLEPIFVYAGKMASSRYEGTLQLVADMVPQMDAPSYEGWKKWRYNTDDRKVRAQIGFLSEEQVSVWREDHFAELGDILIATSPTDRPKQVSRHLQVAITEGHIYNPDIDTSSRYRFVQEQLGSTYNLIASQPEQKEAVMEAEIQRLQGDMQILDNISRYGSLPRIQQAVTMFAEGQTVQINKRTVDTIGFLSQFLTKEQAKALQSAYSDAEKSGVTSLTASAIFTPEILQALRTKVGEIESGYTEALSTDIFERHGLDKTNPKNVGQFYQKRQELKALMDLYRVSKLSAKLIATNRIAEREDKKGETLSTVMEGLRKYFKDSPTFLQDLDNINETITHREDIGANRRLAMIISDNPQMLFQVGKYPTGCGSCQNYEGSPDWNKTLAAYVADSHIKAMFLVDINKLPTPIREDIESRGFDEVKGSIGVQDILEAAVARAMTKIVKTEGQDTALFIEPTYTQINKGDLSMNKYFDIFAELMISEPMGIRLVRGGGSETVHVPVSRNPSGQYEDCAAGDAGHAGMGIQTGAYTMSAKFINKFTPVSDDDRRIVNQLSSL